MNFGSALLQLAGLGRCSECGQEKSRREMCSWRFDLCQTCERTNRPARTDRCGRRWSMRAFVSRARREVSCRWCNAVISRGVPYLDYRSGGQALPHCIPCADRLDLEVVRQWRFENRLEQSLWSVVLAA